MIAYIVPIVMTISLLICIGVGFLIGYFKGAIKGAVDIGVTVLCAIISIPITKLMSMILVNEKILGFILNKLMSILPSSLGSYITGIQDLITSESTQGPVTEIIKLVLSLPVIFVAPIVFVIVFVSLSVVAHIVAFIVQMLVCPKTKNVWLRILGGGLTGSAGALILIVCLLPLIGYANVTTNTISYFKEATESNVVAIENDEEAKSDKINEKISGVLDIVDKYVSPIAKTPMSKVVYACGGKGIFNILTTTQVSKIDVNLQTEINGAIDIYDAAMSFVDNPPKEYANEQVDALDRINDALDDSEFLPLLLSKSISFVANEFSQGHSILGFEKPDLGEKINPTFDKVLAVLKDTDSNDIRNDIKTFSEIIEEANEEGHIKNIQAGGKNIWNILEDEEFVKTVLVELYRNDRTKNMVPYLTGAVTNYVYEMYNDINGTDLQPEEFDNERYERADLEEEARKISNAVRKIRGFIENTDLSEEADPQEVVADADMGALGEGLEELRDCIFTDRLFDLLLPAILHSEAMDELGIVDDHLIEVATKPNADLSRVFVARQNVLKLAIALKEKQDKGETTDITDVMDDILGPILSGEETEEEQELQNFINKDNLISIGMTEEEAESIEAIVDSMIDGAHNIDDEFSPSEKEEELQKTEEILTAISDAIFSGDFENVFATGDGSDSTSGMNASDFVNKITDSKLASEMIKSAIENSSSDPYKIQDKLSQSDKNEITEAISNSYSGADLDQKATLDALAQIFGVTLN